MAGDARRDALFLLPWDTPDKDGGHHEIEPHGMTINFVWRVSSAWLLPRMGLSRQQTPQIYRRLGLHHPPEPRMEFTLLFLAIVIVMLAAWRGPRPLALGLFAALMIACVATYLHHATDTLKLSF